MIKIIIICVSLFCEVVFASKLGYFDPRMMNVKTTDRKIITNSENEIPVFKKTQEELEMLRQKLEQEIMNTFDNDEKFLWGDEKAGLNKPAHCIIGEAPRILEASKSVDDDIETEIQEKLAKRKNLRVLIASEKDINKQMELKKSFAENEESYKKLDLRRNAKKNEVVAIQKQQELSQIIDNKDQFSTLDRRVELKKLFADDEAKRNSLVFDAKVQEINDDLQLLTNAVISEPKKILETTFQYNERKKEQTTTDAAAKKLLEVIHGILMVEENNNTNNNDIRELQNTYDNLLNFMRKNRTSEILIEKLLRNCVDDLYLIIERKKLIMVLDRQAKLIQEKIIKDMHEKKACPVSNESLQDIISRTEQLINKAKQMQYDILSASIKDKLSKGTVELTKARETLLDWQKKEQFQY